MDLDNAKRVVRRRVHRLRNALSDADRADKSTRIAEGVLSLPEVVSANRLLVYVTIRSEVETEGIVAALRARDAVVLGPRVEADGTISARPLDVVEPGFKEIPEPTGHPVSWDEVEVAIVPGVAFDRSGHRLGYGGGFFDRTLATFRGPVIGLAYGCQLIDEVPAGDHDIPVHVVVTEDGIFRTGRQGPGASGPNL